MCACRSARRPCSCTASKCRRDARTTERHSRFPARRRCGADRRGRGRALRGDPRRPHTARRDDRGERSVSRRARRGRSASHCRPTHGHTEPYGSVIATPTSMPRSGALSDATRRGVLEQLWRADASITALAEKFHMTLTGMKKHVGVLSTRGSSAQRRLGGADLQARAARTGRRGGIDSRGIASSGPRASTSWTLLSRT